MPAVVFFVNQIMVTIAQWKQIIKKAGHKKITKERKLGRKKGCTEAGKTKKGHNDVNEK